MAIFLTNVGDSAGLILLPCSSITQATSWVCIHKLGPLLTLWRIWCPKVCLLVAYIHGLAIPTYRMHW